MKNKILTLFVIIFVVFLISGILAENITLPKPPATPTSLSSKNTINNSGSGNLPTDGPNNLVKSNSNNLLWWVLGIAIFLIFILVKRSVSKKDIKTKKTND